MIAVNAGSNSVTTFRVRDGELTHPRTVKSGGDFPASIAVSGRTVYVVNAGGTTNVTGFRLTHDGLRPIARSTRMLGINNDAVPLFTDSPVTFLIVPSRGLLGRSVRYDLLPLSHA